MGLTLHGLTGFRNDRLAQPIVRILVTMGLHRLVSRHGEMMLRAHRLQRREQQLDRGEIVHRVQDPGDTPLTTIEILGARPLISSDVSIGDREPGALEEAAVGVRLVQSKRRIAVTLGAQRS